jgi:hypothetical protein
LIRVNPAQPSPAIMEANSGESAVTDFCFSWPQLTRVLQQAELMDRMMAALGVNPARAARIDRGTAFYEARTRCIGCTLDQSCRTWLSNREDGKSPEPPSFCANAAFFRAAAPRADMQQRRQDNEPEAFSMEKAVAAHLAQPLLKTRT